MDNKPVVIITGMGSEDVKESGKIHCYVCKRTENSKTVFIKDEGEFSKKLLIKMITFENSNNEYRFFLCEECLLLMAALSRSEDLAIHGIEAPMQGNSH